MRGKWTPGPWVKDRFGQLRGSNGALVTVKGLGIALNLAGSGSEEDLANGRLLGAALALHDALHLEVRNCPVCKGDGVTNDTLEHILGRIPASEKVECSRCKNSRAALSLAHTEPSQGEK